MSEPIWDQLIGDELQPNLQLRKLVYSDPKRAVFRADYLDTTANVREVLLRLFLEDESSQGERGSRFLEAKYFEHPRLLRYLETGTLGSEQGTLTYAVTEPGDAWANRSLAPQEALRFAQHVLSGLEYLHNRNLVYCVLSPDTVVPVGTDWKLGDFSQLRVAGTDTSAETLSLRRTWDTCPPETAEGLISPAWDVWAFGQTLRKVLAEYQANVPAPFRGVLLACLNINPSSRPTLSQLAGLLETTRSSDQESGLSTAAWA
jgi:serine/threonine protein kinase